MGSRHPGETPSAPQPRSHSLQGLSVMGKPWDLKLLVGSGSGLTSLLLALILASDRRTRHFV